LGTLESILCTEYSYEIDDKTIASMTDLSSYRSVYMQGKKPKLYINNALYSRQVKFILARELGYQYLGLKERSQTSTPDKIDSFQQLLNDFKAAYFGGALLMRQGPFLINLQDFFAQTTWRPNLLLAMLTEYNVTPEMLLYRFSELVPQFFGLKLHFLRFHHTSDTTDYHLIKQLNMSHLLVPSGIGLLEHHCRRWLSIRLLQEIASMIDPQTVEEMPIGVQHSEFLESQDQFLSMGFARRLVLSPNVYSSVVVGFRFDSDLKHTINFIKDPLIPRIIINETCERCPLQKNECQLRASEPTILLARKQERARKLAIDHLRDR
jgi:Zn-dependent peptidase ImmA (M78 family)